MMPEKRQRTSAALPFISGSDIATLAQLPIYALISSVAPEEKWQSLCFSVERLKHMLSPSGTSQIGKKVEMLGFATGDDEIRVRSMRTEHHVQVLRERLGGWRPRIEIVGLEHLEAAKRGGHGAVLWIAHFSFNSLASKIAFSRAGFDVFHVSRPEHGFTKSRFGIRFLNPIRIGAEQNHAAGRIVIDRANPAASMRTARRLLRANKFVSITAGAWEGQLLVTAKFGCATTEISSGAPRLARVANAPLLPVFVIRDETTKSIRVTVESPIDVQHRGEKATMIRQATQEFADRHLPFLEAHPHQWREWDRLTFRNPA